MKPRASFYCLPYLQEQFSEFGHRSKSKIRLEVQEQFFMYRYLNNFSYVIMDNGVGIEPHIWI